MIFSCWWRIYGYLIPCPGFPGDSDGIESICNLGDLGLIPGLGRSPGGGHGDPFQYSCLENPHRERSLAGYSLQRVRHNWASKHSTAHPISEPESKQVVFSLPFPLQPLPPPPPWRNLRPIKRKWLSQHGQKESDRALGFFFDLWLLQHCWAVFLESYQTL